MLIRVHPLKGVAVLYFLMCILALVLRSITAWVETSTPVDPFASPPALTLVPVDGFLVRVPPGAVRLPDVPTDLPDLIRQSVSRVSAERLDKDKCVPENDTQIGWQKCLGDYLLAAVDEQGKIELVEVYGGKPSRAGFTVACEREGGCDRGVNPPFTISSPPGWTVVALRTAVLQEDGPDGIGGAVYVPFSSRLDDPDLRMQGLEYLRDAVLAAYYELRAKDVVSRHIPGRYVTDFGTPDHVIALILTEQMYSDTWFASGSDLERLEMFNRALVTLGLNRWKSYQYTKSGAGARGIGQIVGGPYQAIREQYPRADLPADSIVGRTDHHTSVKAMICHADAEWWTFAGDDERAHRAFLLQNDEARRLVLAAGYNANVATVHRVIHACKERWREDDCAATCITDPETCVKLPEQTRLYLLKYEWIYRVLFDEAFRAGVEKSVWATLADRARAQQSAYEKRHPKP
ncbi:hypothetical protein HY631_00165 [Candidatus Uhrbacteria bacterium]|nr:hypothetical protein [Candidatus Uhrbacteria bacterium]